MSQNLITVSISCITYNHEPYIRKALDGFLMQKTTFQIEILIHDDASTDGTEEIIREYESKYPDIIKPIYEKENQWVKGRRGSKEFNYPRAQGKYIAICEGDDYWIDPYKLQKQVDFLEENPNCGLMYTDYDKLNEGNKVIENNKFKDNKLIKNTFDDFLINRWFIAPCTWVLRASILELLDKPLAENNVVGDFPLLLGFSKYSEIAYLNESTAVYRVLENSASHFKKTIKNDYNFWYGIFSIQMKFATYFNVSENIILKIKIPFFTEYFVSICLFGDTRFRKEVFYYLKTKGSISNKHKVFFVLTKFRTIKKLLFLHYK